MTWWNSSWSKKKKITLTGGFSGAQTAYQVKLDVVYDGDMKSDFSDLRFTNGAEDTLLDAWLESKIDSTSAVVWVETDTPASGATGDIYMYYGNSAAASAWDIGATMLFGDEFSGTALDTSKWTEEQGTAAVSGGEMTLDAKERIGSINSFGTNTAIRARCKTPTCAASGTTDIGYGYYGLDADAINVHCYGSVNFSLLSEKASTLNTVVSMTYDASYHIFDIIREGSTTSKLYIDGGNLVTLGTTYTPTINLDVNIATRYDTANSSIVTDWIFVRKYAANPATYAFGDEEEGGWAGKIIGVTNPAKVMGITVDNIANVIGVS